MLSVVVADSMVMSAGIGLIGSGAIEVTGGYGFNRKKTVNVRPKDHLGLFVLESLMVILRMV